MKSFSISFLAALLLSCLASSVVAFSGSMFQTSSIIGVKNTMTSPIAGRSIIVPSISTAAAAAASTTTTALFGKKEARAKGNERKNKERVRKTKDDVIEVDAVVLESLPNAMFRCAIDGAADTQATVLATISGKIRKNFVKILVGDKVLIELSPYDLTRGRITFRHR